ncbi:FAD-dependent oxidoreductase [Pseudomonas alliivorans]|nr:FAD-dependent oxidoreductase [Pseudomonas alliivorans]
MKTCDPIDVIILGGGLAGLMAAIRLIRQGKKVTLVDNSLPEAGGKLGGFAKFSGAKFSLPPAGMGLLTLAGTKEKLHQKINEVIELLGIDSLAKHSSFERGANEEVYLGLDAELRSYHSIVLTPLQIDDLLARLTILISNSCQLIKGKAESISQNEQSWTVAVRKIDSNLISNFTAKSIFYAAGRLESKILTNAGAAEYPGKGLDVGFRVEFMQRESVGVLRDLGPDAKIIHKSSRTFCLNSPGEIFYYKYGNIDIPGGVVANDNVNTANVGILSRIKDKKKGSREIVDNYAKIRNLQNSKLQTGRPDLCADLSLSIVLGEEVTKELQDFTNILGDLHLINWELPYRIHYPLIDWYWGTYCSGSSHKTSLRGIYALGDSAGHARGLLQAALSGWLASEEYLSEINH